MREVRHDPRCIRLRPGGSAEEAVAQLVEHGDDAKLLAGGHSLLPLMKLRLATPAVLVDIGRLPDLSYIEERRREIAIGALDPPPRVETSDLLTRRCRCSRTPPA